MSRIDEKTKLVALAHLATDKKPREVSELMDIPYATALRLSKELTTAQQKNDLNALFSMSEAARESLFNAVRQDLEISSNLLDQNALEGEILTLQKSVDGLDALDKNFQSTAKELSNQIRLLAATSQNSDTIVNLSIALAKLQESFFAKGTNVQVNQFGNQSGFEEFLQD